MVSFSLIEFSLALLLLSTAAADAYNIWVPLCKTFELKFSSIMFLKFIRMLLNPSFIDFSIWSNNALFSRGLITGQSGSASL